MKWADIINGGHCIPPDWGHIERKGGGIYDWPLAREKLGSLSFLFSLSLSLSLTRNPLQHFLSLFRPGASGQIWCCPEMREHDLDWLLRPKSGQRTCGLRTAVTFRDQNVSLFIQSLSLENAWYWQVHFCPFFFGVCVWKGEKKRERGRERKCVCVCCCLESLVIFPSRATTLDRAQ